MFERLFEPLEFWPRCLMWTNVISNAIIGFSYYIIPISLYIYNSRGRKLVHAPWVVFWIVVFIVSCGTAHLISALTFWRPFYRLLTTIDAITAVISVITAFLLPRIIWVLTKLRTNKELLDVNTALELASGQKDHILANVRELNHDLANQVQRLQNIIATQGWIAEKQVDLEKMKEIIVNLRKEYAAKPISSGDDNT